MSRSSSSGGSSDRGPAAARRDGTLVFVAGTDTGVGKTFLTARLLRRWREQGIDAAAMKPFASGDRGDARRLQRQQPGVATLAGITPFLFPAPAAAWIGIQPDGPRVSLAQARAAIDVFRRGRKVVLVEGCGGLLAPLGDGFALPDLMPTRGARVLVVAANRLGVLNHARLTLDWLATLRQVRLRLVLVDTEPSRRDDPARATNLAALRKLLGPVPVTPFPYEGRRAGSEGREAEILDELGRWALAR